MTEHGVEILAEPENVIVDKDNGIVEIKNATITVDGLFGKMLISAHEQTVAKWVVNHKDTWDMLTTLSVMLASDIQMFHKAGEREERYGQKLNRMRMK